MDRLEAIKVFAEVARQQGFSPAARKLGQPLATVSRKVAALEEHLGVCLLIRTTRNVRLSKDGEQYLEKVLPLVSALDETDALMAYANETLSGELVITSPVPFGVHHLVPVIAQFLSFHPEITIQHLIDNRHLNYVTAGIDVGLRVGLLEDSSLKMMKLGDVRNVTCASPAYLEKHGSPKTPEDLSKHRIVAYNARKERFRWNFAHSDSSEYYVELKPFYRVDSMEAIIQLVSNGAGIGGFFSYQVAELIADGRLRILMPDHEPTMNPVSFIWPGSVQLPRRTRAFLDFAAPPLKAKLDDMLQMIEGKKQYGMNADC